MRAISGRDRPRRAEYQHTSALLSAHHDIINPRALHHGYASGEGALIFTSGVSRQRTFQHLALEDLVNLHSLEPLCAPAIQLESPRRDRSERRSFPSAFHLAHLRHWRPPAYVRNYPSRD